MNVTEKSDELCTIILNAKMCEGRSFVIRQRRVAIVFRKDALFAKVPSAYIGVDELGIKDSHMARS